MTTTTPGPNARLHCGTWSARVNHLAHGQSCDRCGTDRPLPEQPEPDREEEAS